MERGTEHDTGLRGRALLPFPHFPPTGLLRLEENCTTIRKADCTTLACLRRASSLGVASVKGSTSTLCRIANKECVEASDVLRLGLEIHIAVHENLTFQKLTLLNERE